MSYVVPFAQFDEQNVNLWQAHAQFGPDLYLAGLSCEFSELATEKTVTSMKLPDLVRHLSSNADSYPNVSTVMSRILAAKPHSADVERCSSANNLLKTSLRSGLKLTMENCYLFIHHNLPPTAVWDRRLTVLNWLKKTHREKGQTKAKLQPYFRQVFAKAQKNCTDIDVTERTDTKENQACEKMPRGRQF